MYLIFFKLDSEPSSDPYSSSTSFYDADSDPTETSVLLDRSRDESVRSIDGGDKHLKHLLRQLNVKQYIVKDRFGRRLYFLKKGKGASYIDIGTVKDG